MVTWATFRSLGYKIEKYIKNKLLTLIGNRFKGISVTKCYLSVVYN